MVSANPRDIGNLYRPRTQEFTGGHNPRQVLDLQINPNEDDDGLAHNSRNTTEDSESRDQRNPEKRRERALRELVPALQHISVRPSEMDEMIERSPRFEEENKLLETGLGADIGARGLSIAAGANRGPVRSDTPYVNYGRGTTNAFGKSEIEKAKRKYKGRKYSEDEEDEEEEKKSKKKNKREKKRRGEKGKKKAGGKLRRSASRDPKRTSRTRAAGVAHAVDRDHKNQKFGHQLSRRFGLGSSTELPLRLRDPIAYARKLANEKNRRLTGALPSAMTHHRSSGAGVSETQTRGGTIGGTKGGTGTKLATPPQLGTSMRNGATIDRITEQGLGDPLGVSDPLYAKMLLQKAKGNLTRTEIIALKKKIESMLRRLEKVTKAPELEENAKRGAQASEDVASAPQGGTKRLDPWMFDDTSINTVVGTVGKR